MYQSKDKKNAEQSFDNATSDLKSAKGELKNAKDSAISAAKGEFNNLSNRAEDKVRGLRETARETGEKVQHFLHERRDDVSHARDTAERQIRANPLAAAGILLAAGAVLGRLLKR